MYIKEKNRYFFLKKEPGLLSCLTYLAGLACAEASEARRNAQPAARSATCARRSLPAHCPWRPRAPTVPGNLPTFSPPTPRREFHRRRPSLPGIPVRRAEVSLPEPRPTPCAPRRRPQTGLASGQAGRAVASGGRRGAEVSVGGGRRRLGWVDRSEVAAWARAPLGTCRAPLAWSAPGRGGCASQKPLGVGCSQSRLVLKRIPSG